MKVFLVMIFCVQNPFIPVENTCLIEYQKKPFENIATCLAEANKIKKDNSHLTDLYLTGFCTTKTIQGV